MISNNYLILAQEGFHARPAKMFVKLLRGCKSDVIIKKDTFETDAKSMLGLLAMQADYRSNVTIQISGEDEQEISTKLDQFFNHDMISL